MGENTNLHTRETVVSNVKQGSIHAFGSSAITMGEAFAMGGMGVGGIMAAGKVVDGFKKHFAGEGAKARTNGDGYAVKAEDGNWYETNEKGEGLIGKDGKPISANGKLQPSSVTAVKAAWEGTKNAAYDLKDKLSGAFSEESIDKASHSNSGKNASSTNNSVNNNSQHGSSPKSDMHNYNTSGKSAQGAFGHIAESVKNITPASLASGAVELAKGFSMGTLMRQRMLELEVIKSRNVNMQSSPQQMVSSVSIADAVNATRASSGVQLTASDILLRRIMVIFSCLLRGELPLRKP
jgi:hypothetical protein